MPTHTITYILVLEDVFIVFQVTIAWYLVIMLILSVNQSRNQRQISSNICIAARLLSYLLIHLECLHMPSWHLFKMGGPGAKTLISIPFHTLHGYMSMCAAYCARHLLISLIEQLGFLIFKALKAGFNFACSYPARVTVRYSDEPWNGGALHEPKGGFCTR